MAQCRFSDWFSDAVLRVLDYIYTRPCPTLSGPVIQSDMHAVEGGHLAVLQWARPHGCDWERAGCLIWAPAGSETREWIEAQPA